MNKVKSPDHYKITEDLESIDILRALMTEEEFVGFCWGNVMKYIFRWKKKNGREDLKKARVYIDWILEVKG